MGSEILKKTGLLNDKQDKFTTCFKTCGTNSCIFSKRVKKLAKKELKTFRGNFCGKFSRWEGDRFVESLNVKEFDEMRTLYAIAKVFEKILNVENLVELNEKTSLRSILKGDLPTCSFLRFGGKF